MTYLQENEASRVELGRLAATLNEADFARETGHGWTVGTIFCHLAFWDRRVLYLLKKWQRSGFEVLPPSKLVLHSVNEAVNVISRSIPGPLTARMAIESAAAVDAEIERLSAELVEQLRAGGYESVVRRSPHREEHMRKIQAALAGPEAPAS